MGPTRARALWTRGTSHAEHAGALSSVAARECGMAFQQQREDHAGDTSRISTEPARNRRHEAAEDVERSQHWASDDADSGRLEGLVRDWQHEWRIVGNQASCRRLMRPVSCMRGIVLRGGLNRTRIRARATFGFRWAPIQATGVN